MKQVRSICDYKNIIYLRSFFGIKHIWYETNTNTIFLVNGNKFLPYKKEMNSYIYRSLRKYMFVHYYSNKTDCKNLLLINNEMYSLYELLIKGYIIPINIKEKINYRYIWKQKIKLFILKFFNIKINTGKIIKRNNLRIKDILYEDKNIIIFITDYNWIYILLKENIKENMFENIYSISNNRETLTIVDSFYVRNTDNLIKNKKFYNIQPQNIFSNSLKINLNQFIKK